MTNSVHTITPENGAELDRLKAVFLAATARASAIGQREGMSSPKFREADDEATAALRRAKEILGITGHPWNA
jgi:hypothetical protein